MAEKKQLTEKQRVFLDVLFMEAKGDFHKAHELAGYSENTNVYVVMSKLREEIGEKLKEALGTAGSIQSYKTLMSVLDGTDDPLGRKERVSVAKDLLDRAGFKGTDKVEVTAPNNVFILPPKSNETK